MKKVLSLILCLIMVSVFNISASAANPEGNDPEPVIPEYTRVTMISAGLDISSTGVATCSGVVMPYYSTDIVTLIVRLQYWTENGWVNYYTWETTDSGVIIDLYETQSVPAGFSYRVRISAHCEPASGNESETVYANSYIRTYP